jgi:predicted nucleotidyltransferase
VKAKNSDEATKIALQYALSLKKTFGPDLEMVAVYGSVARGEFKPEISDINVVAIMSRFNLDILKKITPLVQSAKDESNISTLLLTEKELTVISEVFPIKYYDMRKYYEVVQGYDFLRSLKVEWKFFRERVRQEILDIELRLRKSLLLNHPNTEVLKEPLNVFIPHLLTMLRALVDTPESQKFDVDDVFLKALKEKKFRVKEASYDEVMEIYGLIFTSLEAVLKAVENVENAEDTENVQE